MQVLVQPGLQDVLTPNEINMILTAVVSGMGPTEAPESRLAATVALCNAIEFAQHNFENENERNYLMQVSQRDFKLGICTPCRTNTALSSHRLSAKALRHQSCGFASPRLSVCMRLQLSTMRSWCVQPGERACVDGGLL